jgi:hypothetical protein
VDEQKGHCLIRWNVVLGGIMADRLEFDHALLAKGIQYHIAQKHHAFWNRGVKTITPDSISGLTFRFLMENHRASIARIDWKVMSDTDRLLWMLKITGTTLIPLNREDGLWELGKESDGELSKEMNSESD